MSHPINCLQPRACQKGMISKIRIKQSNRMDQTALVPTDVAKKGTLVNRKTQIQFLTRINRILDTRRKYVQNMQSTT